MRQISEILDSLETRRHEIARLTRDPSCVPPEYGRPPRSAVLLVDDEPRWLKYAAAEFRDHGTCYTATSADRAIDELQAHPDIGVVVTDLRMPVHDGEWLIDQIASRWPSVRCIALTAYTDCLVKIRAKVARIFAKPCDIRELARYVDRQILEVVG